MDIIHKHLKSGPQKAAAVKAAYMAACNAGEGAAFRVAVCALSEKHAKVFADALAAKGSEYKKGAYSAWRDSLGAMPSGTALMETLVNDSNARAAKCCQLATGNKA